MGDVAPITIEEVCRHMNTTRDVLLESAKDLELVAKFLGYYIRQINNNRIVCIHIGNKGIRICPFYTNMGVPDKDKECLH